LVAWMAQRLSTELSDPDTIMSNDAANDQGLDGITFHEDTSVYALSLLSQGSTMGTVLVGVAALGGEREAPPACSPELLRLVCELLRDRSHEANRS
ncbi:MAG TPA: hypothetical protein VMF89_34175, partial [Polyangiales bacterium]|nr:hypothetical protein [Polyangiales bacterium]